MDFKHVILGAFGEYGSLSIRDIQIIVCERTKERLTPPKIGKIMKPFIDEGLIVKRTQGRQCALYKLA